MAIAISNTRESSLLEIVKNYHSLGLHMKISDFIAQMNLFGVVIIININF